MLKRHRTHRIADTKNQLGPYAIAEARERRRPLPPLTEDLAGRELTNAEISNRPDAMLEKRLAVIRSQTGETDTNEAKAILQELRCRNELGPPADSPVTNA